MMAEGDGNSGQQRLPTALGVIAGVLLVIAAIASYASDSILDGEKFADRTTAALADEAVSNELASRITDDVVINAEADLVAVRPVIEGAIAELIRGGAFQKVMRAALVDLHRGLVEEDESSLTLTLADVGVLVRGALQALAPRVAESIPVGVDAEVSGLEPPAVVTELVQAGHKVRNLAIALVVLAVVLAIAAVAIASDRRLAVLRIALSIAVSAALALVALSIARQLVLAAIEDPGIRDAAGGVWSALLGDLRDGLLILAGCGAVVAAAASSLLTPMEAGSLGQRIWRVVSTTPQRPVLRVLRALGLMAFGILVIAYPGTALELAAIAAGLTLVYLGLTELLRMATAGTERERTTQRKRGARSIAVAAIAIALIAIAAGAFVSSGGLEESSPALGRSGCNGYEELCDLPLNEVVFPATHNSMSAASNPGWLFAQHEAGIASQLRDGVRGFLIDAHWGQRTESGQVRTDLDSPESIDRAKYVETLGEDALDAGLRIRDRIVNSPTVEDPSVYLCHAFCELGALPIDEVFGQFRDFLAANPNEVLFVVIEDYVPPDAIGAAMDRTGLVDYAWDGPLQDPVPTMRELIDADKRLILLAENHDGGEAVPYYHSAYDGLVQETPYHFESPDALIGDDNLEASCQPNRGDDDAPYFLINHWVDTSPAPRPSNARQVNAKEPLMKRIRECERVRGLLPGLVAVDFYREGDLFDVAGELNTGR